MVYTTILTTAIHNTLASHKLISTNFSAFKIHWRCHYKHFKISTPILKKLHRLPIKQRIDYKLRLLTYKTLTNQQPTYISLQKFFISLTFFFYKIFWFTCSLHSIYPIITWQKGFLCHRSTTLKFTTFCYPKLVFSTNSPFQAQTTSLQNCVPSLGSFPSPLIVYSDFDSCYSHFMPYQMAPGFRHRAIRSWSILL